MTEVAEGSTHVGVRVAWRTGTKNFRESTHRSCATAFQLFLSPSRLGSPRIATLPVPRRRAAGACYRHRLHHLVCGGRAFGAGRSIVLGRLRLLFYGAYLLS